jgi:SAM-dependent methyltransferase
MSLKKKIKKIVNQFGNKVWCPFCKKTFFKFEKYGEENFIFKKKRIIGGGYRKDCVCPNCFSLDRSRLLYFYLKYKTKFLKKNIKVLHIAPEKNMSKFFKNLSNIDYYSGDLSKNRKTHKFVQFNIEALPFKNQSFDLVLCSHVLEHIREDKKSMKNIFFCLKKKELL